MRCSVGTSTNIYSERFFDVQDHTTHSDHDYLEYRAVTSLEFSNDLPAEVDSDFENPVPSAVDPDNSGRP